MDRVALFKALSSPTRLKIVDILANGERCACELPEMVGKSQPAVSLQLKKLVDLGVLKNRRMGTKSIYSIADQKVIRMLRLV